MKIRASIQSYGNEYRTELSTDGRSSVLPVAGRPSGGSSVNGGELLCLALATCYCNDLYREAAQLGIAITSVAVDVDAEFGGAGDPARRITYAAHVESDASAAEIEALLQRTDAVAEVHNTLRAGIAVERRSEA